MRGRLSFEIVFGYERECWVNRRRAFALMRDSFPLCRFFLSFFLRRTSIATCFIFSRALQQLHNATVINFPGAWNGISCVPVKLHDNNPAHRMYIVIFIIDY